MARSRARVGSGIGVDSPRIPLVFEPLVQDIELLGETGFHQHAVLADPGDLGNVLVEHRTDFHAGGAGGAIPEFLLADHFAQQFLPFPRVCVQSSFRFQKVFLEFVEQLLGRKDFSRLERRADVVAAAAFGTGKEIEQILAGHVADDGGSEFLLFLEIDQGDLGFDSIVPQNQVHRPGNQVQMFGIQDENPKTHDHQDMQPPEKMNPSRDRDRGNGSGGRKEIPKNPTRKEIGPGGRFPVHPESLIKEERDHQHEDEGENRQRLVRGEIEPGGTEHITPDQEIADGDEDQSGEQVGAEINHSGNNPVPIQGEAPEEPLGDMVDGDEQKDKKSPKNQCMEKTGHRAPRNDRYLKQDLSKHLDDPPDGTVKTCDRLPLEDQSPFAQHLFESQYRGEGQGHSKKDFLGNGQHHILPGRLTTSTFSIFFFRNISPTFRNRSGKSVTKKSSWGIPPAGWSQPRLVSIWKTLSAVVSAESINRISGPRT